MIPLWRLILFVILCGAMVGAMLALITFVPPPHG